MPVSSNIGSVYNLLLVGVPKLKYWFSQIIPSSLLVEILSFLGDSKFGWSQATHKFLSLVTYFSMSLPLAKNRMLNILHRGYLRFVEEREERVYYRAMRRLFRLKPVLSYLEFNLVDHCNMNCSGCSHFSPLADELFANIKHYDNDMKQLSKLVANIRVFRLLGGEPLLHPEVGMFLTSTRTWFPKAKICLVTNGLLLSSMPMEFWESCRRNSISIEVTLYPPLIDKETDFLQLAKNEKIMLNVVKASEFYIFVNSKGDSELEKGFRRCRKRSIYRPLLREGKVYNCYMPALVHYFNAAYGTNIPNTGFVDLYDPKMTGWKMLSLIEKKSDACRYCATGWIKVPTQVWTKSCFSQKEWDVTKIEALLA